MMLRYPLSAFAHMPRIDDTAYKGALISQPFHWSLIYVFFNE